METLGRTQDGNGGRSRYGNKSSSGDRNGDEDGKGGEIEDGIGEGGVEEDMCKKPLIDAMWETGETLVERGENVDKEGLVQ